MGASWLLGALIPAFPPVEDGQTLARRLAAGLARPISRGARKESPSGLSRLKAGARGTAGMRSSLAHWLTQACLSLNLGVSVRIRASGCRASLCTTQQVPPEIACSFERRLNQAKVPAAQHPGDCPWLNLYFLFCQKFGYSPAVVTSLGPSLKKLAEKNYSIEDRRQASAAVKPFLRPEPQASAQCSPSKPPGPSSSQPAVFAPPIRSGPAQMPDMPRRAESAGRFQALEAGPNPKGSTSPPGWVSPARPSSREREYRDFEGATRLPASGIAASRRCGAYWPEV